MGDVNGLGDFFEFEKVKKGLNILVSFAEGESGNIDSVNTASKFNCLLGERLCAKLIVYNSYGDMLLLGLAILGDALTSIVGTLISSCIKLSALLFYIISSFASENN